MEYLFRIRRAAGLLDDFHELENQTIYFATPEELNDGYEGLPNVVWIGDECAWRSLFLKFFEFAKSKGLNKKQTDVFKLEIDSMLRCIGSKKECVIVNENAMFYLLSKVLEAKYSDAQAVDIFYGLNRFIRLLKGCDAERTEVEGYLLEYRHKNSAVCIDSDFYGVALSYVECLKKLLYPDWGVSCFMKKRGIENPSTWGYYGDAGKGAALIFEPDIDVVLHGARFNFGESGGLVLYGEDAERGASRVCSVNFSDVEYSNVKPRVSFFESMGKICRDDVDEWCSLGLNKSVMLNVENGINDFRKKQFAYWSGFLKSTTIKSEGWAHEDERRLVLNEFSHNSFCEDGGRLLRYRFESLKGIIFGPCMDKKNKQAIVDIISKKCKTEARKSFVFKQAFFDQESGGMSFVDLGCLQN